jgi:hypothetical protein
MQVEKKQSDKLVENANYLFSCLNGGVDISEESSYDFAVKHPTLSR